MAGEFPVFYHRTEEQVYEISERRFTVGSRSLTFIVLMRHHPPPQKKN